MTEKTLPIDVLGNWYEVPVQVQLHIIAMRERLAAIDAAPTVAMVRTAPGTDYRFVSFCVLDRDKPGDTTELIARPAKDSP